MVTKSFIVHFNLLEDAFKGAIGRTLDIAHLYLCKSGVVTLNFSLIGLKRSVPTFAELKQI